MINDPLLFSVFSLCVDKGRFVYEILPDYFGDCLTLDEIQYWMVYGMLQSAIRYDIEYELYSLGELKDKIIQAKSEQKRKMESWKRK